MIKEEADSLREELKRSVDPPSGLNDCKVKLSEHDDELCSQDARLAALEANYAELSNRYEKLQTKVDDMENRGRRNNLRLIFNLIIDNNYKIMTILFYLFIYFLTN